MRLWIVIALSGCGRIGFDAASDGRGGGDVRGTADALDLARGPWSPPTLITTINSSVDDEEPTFTADRLELVFRSGAIDLDLFVSKRASTSDPWGPPSRIDELSLTTSVEYTPGIAPDGLTLWFSSNRSGRFDVWVSTRPTRSSPWGAPALAGVPDLGAPSAPMYDGSGLWICVDQNPDIDIWRAMGTPPASWATFTPVAELNSLVRESSPRTWAGGLRIVFNSERADGSTMHFYEASRASLSEPFGNITPFTELDSNTNDWDMWISEDGHYAIFGSGRSGKQALYETFR